MKFEMGSWEWCGVSDGWLEEVCDGSCNFLMLHISVYPAFSATQIALISTTNVPHIKKKLYGSI